jgi:hypothetical protein
MFRSTAFKLHLLLSCAFALLLVLCAAHGLHPLGTLAVGGTMAMFIGPCYNVTNNGVSISTAITVVQVKAGVNGAIEILRAALTNGTAATSAQYAAALFRKTAAATVTTGVAGTTVLKQNPVNPTTDAALSTTGTGITASAEGTNGEEFVSDGFNDLNGFLWLPAQEERLMVPQSGILGLTYLVAPQSATRYGRIVWRELRGG